MVGPFETEFKLNTVFEIEQKANPPIQMSKTNQK